MKALKEITDELIKGPVAIVFILIFELFILPALIFAKLVNQPTPSVVVKDGVARGKEMLDLKVCFLISLGFWAFLYFVLNFHSE